MKNTNLSMVTMALLCLAGLGNGSPVPPVAPRLIPLEPGGGMLETRRFKGGERASVIGVGRDKNTFVGLYVYDEHGSCVAWDDIGTASTKDRVTVEWFPVRTAPFTVEVRNFGLALNKLEFAVR
jgi:hypothetical protein